MEGLSHTHEDDIGDRRPRLAGPRGVGERTARLQNLIDDLVRGEAPLEAEPRCRAEGAAHAAPDLR